MTLAAGFVYREGVLLCAETELTAGDLKTHGAKILPFDCPFGRIGMVCSGNFVLAVAAMQSIKRAVLKLDPHVHPLETVISTLDREYQRTVWANPSFAAYGPLEFQLLVAIQGKSGSTELYSSDGNSLVEVSGHACIGSGSVVAERLIDQAFLAIGDRGRLLAFLSHMMNVAKRGGAGVGGMSLFVDLGFDGTQATFYGDGFSRQSRITRPSSMPGRGKWPRLWLAQTLETTISRGR